jgi:hypothetical protein
MIASIHVVRTPGGRLRVPPRGAGCDPGPGRRHTQPCDTVDGYGESTLRKVKQETEKPQPAKDALRHSRRVSETCRRTAATVSVTADCLRCQHNGGTQKGLLTVNPVPTCFSMHFSKVLFVQCARRVRQSCGTDQTCGRPKTYGGDCRRCQHNGGTQKRAAHR